MSRFEDTDRSYDVAVVGMAARFPGAADVDRFWRNLCDGVESASFFSPEELRSSGVDPEVIRNPNYVPARFVLDDVEQFDAEFFGFDPQEARILDPQLRILMECTWKALENAGYDPGRYPGRIGFFGGVSANTYLLSNIYQNVEVRNSVSNSQLKMASDKDYMTTRISYKLNLKGPSINVHTACSTSLVATHFACQSLLNRECDMALAGASSVVVPQKTGYFYQEGGLHSPDGHCRAFDAEAAGMVFGNGAGLVVLKRFDDAVEDGDRVRAVIKGSAINNDGSSKVGYTAPSVEGQAEVIAEAISMARVSPETISYVETHGTGTAFGDVIEIAALKKAFALYTSKTGFCALGSVKTNVGHLDLASGVASLIKAVLALENRRLPRSLNFEKPHPELGIEESPFFVNTELREWETESAPLRAGVSAFGIGGTNAHLILEEAPAPAPSGEARPWQLLPLSARTSSALEQMTANLVESLKRQPDLNLADIAYTLQVGRGAFAHRRLVVSRSLGEAVADLETLDPRRALTAAFEGRPRTVVVWFSGQGRQTPDATLELYRHEPRFRKRVDHCSELLKPALGKDLRELLYPQEEQREEAARQLERTRFGQPALFVVEYALARLLDDWGVRAETMIGDGRGEYVAACLAGVFSLADALSLAAARGRLEDSLSAESHEESPGSPSEAILEAFHEQVRRIDLKAPERPYLSTATGTWVTAQQATDSAYWRRHMGRPVSSMEEIREMLSDPDRILLRIDPGDAPAPEEPLPPADSGEGPVVLSLLPPSRDTGSELRALVTTLGRLWLAGIEVDWLACSANERRQRVALPTYPFERLRHWVDPVEGSEEIQRPRRSASAAEGFYLPSWKRTLPAKPSASKAEVRNWLLFVDPGGWGACLAERLRRAEQKVVTVEPADRYEKLGKDRFSVDPRRRRDFEALLEALDAQAQTPDAVAYLWSVPPGHDRSGSGGTEPGAQGPEESFVRFLLLAQALAARHVSTPIEVWVISNQIHDVTGTEDLDLDAATLLGPLRVLPLEHPNLCCCNLDVAVSGVGPPPESILCQLLAEMTAGVSQRSVAYRGGHRWVEVFEPVRLEEPEERPELLRPGGVYLVTGGLKAVGFSLAKYLAKSVAARLVVVGPAGLPAREEWEGRLVPEAGEGRVVTSIRRLRELESLGAEVLYASADVTDRDSMREAITAGHRRFGEIHGVLHAAGLLGQGILALKRPEDARAVLAPKIRGALILDELLREQPLDFVLYCSSRMVDAPLPGQVDYCAANAFLNAFACHKSRRGGPPTVAVGWDLWQELSMAEEADLPPEIDKVLDQARRRFDLDELELEGLAAFRKILASGTAPQIIISREDVAEHIAEIHTLVSQTSHAGQRSRETMAMATPYVAPRNEIERAVAEISQELLGIDQIGIHDNFFDLGANSLLLTRLVSRLREEFGVEVPLRSTFDAPTVEGMAAVVPEKQFEQVDDASLAKMFEEIRNLSEEEAQSLFESEMGSTER